jgi:predicted dehydrogenase
VLELHGTAGTVRMKDDGVDLWQLADLTDGEQAEVLRRYSGQASGTFADPMAMSFDNHRRQIHDFLQAIETDAAPLVDGREGLRSVALVEAIYRAAQTKKPVTLTTP